MKQVLTLICIINSIFVNAQSLSETLSFADSLYTNQTYELATESYKRVLFFDKNGVYTNQTYPKIADCLFQTEKYDEAATYFDLAYFSESNEEKKSEHLLKKAASLLILKQYDYALIEIYNLPEALTEEQQKEKNTLEAIIYFAKNDFDASRNSFNQVASDTSKINALFVQNKKVDRIKPKTAKVLSMIIPGLGQLYVGDIKNGLNSFILTGGLLTLGIHSAIVNSPLDAAFAVLPWFQRYYQGGFKKAEIIAKAKIDEKRFAIYNKLLDNIQPN